MLEQAKMHIANVLESGIIGTKEECEYYPCHFQGQDCTWCFCPVYPCLDDKTGGKYVQSKRTKKDVWSCINCKWIHTKEVPEKVLVQMRKLSDWALIDDCKKIRSEILGD